MEQITQRKTTRPVTTEPVVDLPGVVGSDVLDATTDVLTDLDAVIADGEAAGDEALLDAAAAFRVSTVRAGTAIPTVQAWSVRGVD